MQLTEYDSLLIFVLLQAVSAAATTTQRAYVATSVDENGYVTNSTFQQHSIPTVGDLRTMYTGLPIQACELLIKIAASSINPSDIHPKVAPQLLPHVQRQIEVIKQREPKILDSDANFIFRVLKERTLIAMEQDRLRATQTVQRQEDDKAHSFTIEQPQKY